MLEHTRHKSETGYIAFECPKRGWWIDSSRRGTFLVDNTGRLKTTIPRGDNIRFIASYLYNNPCSKSADIRKALMLWRGVMVTDKSRGYYSSYFYDKYLGKWYYDKLFTKIRPFEGMRGIRLNLTIEGMQHVDLDLCDKLKNIDGELRPRTLLFIQEPDDIDKMEGYLYDEIIQ